MLYGVITRDEYNNVILKVQGYPRMIYIFYSLREAIRRYRQEYNLQRRHIEWSDKP